jgi:site-specific recombinase XerD
MNRRNPENERIKLQYYEFLKQADGKSDQTIRQVEKAILRFEEFTGFASLKSFDQKQATGFKEFMAEKALALATILSTMNSLKRFLRWLSMQPGYKTAIKPTDIEYLNLPEKDIRAASAPANKRFPSLQMVENVIALMPHKTTIEKRDRALVAFTAITGIRDGAIITLKLKHFDTSRMLILQNPLEVATKFRKRIDTFLFPLNDDLEKIVLGWLGYLKQELFFADHDPLFPKTALGHEGAMTTLTSYGKLSLFEQESLFRSPGEKLNSSDLKTKLHALLEEFN